MSVAFIFPGQGSQSVGMLGSLAEKNTAYGDIVNATFKQASDALGYDLWELCQNGPESELNLTKNTQPAMLAAGYALWLIWNEKKGRVPCLMAGHSLGEYTALVCAESLDFKEAIKLVYQRGRLMQESIKDGQGAMAAVLGLEEDVVVDVCNNVQSSLENRVVAAVNFNSPGQVVIAGHADAVEKAMQAVNDAGAKKVISLQVSVPSHCELMKDASKRLQDMLNTIEIQRPIIPVINNVHVTIESDEDLIRDALVRQLYKPVRWREIIEKMVLDGVEQVVECGPGKVLAGLNRRINRRMPAHTLYDEVTIEKTFEELS